ncbi:MAG TPA: hypothetical protein VGN04_09570 [Herbaspirillum sp.]|jgi:DNA polymerase
MTMQIDAAALARRIAVLDEIGVGPLWMRRGLMADALPAADVRPSEPAVMPTPMQTPAPSSPRIAPAPVAVQSNDGDAAWDDDALQAGAAAPVKTVLALCTATDVADTARYLFVSRGSGVQGSEELFANMLAALGLRKEAGAQGDLAGLQAQAEAQRASVLIAMGPAIALALAGDREEGAATAGDERARFESLRGRLHRGGALPLLVTYDAAHLLRNPIDKRGAWDDLCLLRHLQRPQAPDVADPA